jgi:hypothetical protein
MSGFEFGFPGITDSLAAAHPRVLYADIQGFVGQYIDPTDPVNFSKFVNLTTVGGVIGGTPVDPSIARAAFGPQTFLFKGGRNGGVMNGGTAGTFVKTGTVNDTLGPHF